MDTEDKAAAGSASQAQAAPDKKKSWAAPTVTYLDIEMTANGVLVTAAENTASHS
jgi:hypothetical protein